MFGNASLPSRNFVFGALAPTENAALTSEQMFLAHRYYNTLVEIERERRGKCDAAIRDLCPQVALLSAAVAAIEKRLEEALSEIKRANAQARKKTAPRELRERAKEFRGELRAARAALKAEKKTAYADPRVIAAQDQIDAENAEKRKAARAASGLYFGTYLLIEQSLGSIRSGAPPKFKRWTGDGTVAAQVQKGCSIDELLSGEDRRVRVDLASGYEIDDKGRTVRTREYEEFVAKNGRTMRRRKRDTISVRVGSNPDRTPIMCQVPARVHRPMPSDARIKWAFLSQTRVGTHREYRIRLSVERAAGWRKDDLADSGTVAVDIGWRIVPGGLRVAAWRGDDGATGELILPQAVLDRLRKCESLQSIRDRNFEPVRDALAKWIAEATRPDWVTERAQTLRQWKSQARLAGLVIFWRANRFDGDGEMFARVEAWRKQDKHLYDWQSCQRLSTQRRRMDLYRNFAAMLTRRYKTIVVEEFDLRKVQKLPAADAEPVDAAVREHQRDACCSALVRCLRERAAEFREVDAVHSTTQCSSCGKLSDFDRRDVIRECAHCGHRCDQDYGAAAVILARALLR